MKTYTLLKVVVGSQAHGLAGQDSDFDYRSVYALPTVEILSLGYKYKGSQWLEGDTEDNTAWEVGHFLTLAMQCNPTILEVFLAPIAEYGVDANADGKTRKLYEYGLQLRGLFSCIWNPQKAFDAFTGYGKNQQKKFLDKKDSRPHKYAVAHIRTLCNLIELLDTGTFNVNMSSHKLFPMLQRIKRHEYSIGEVVDVTESLTREAEMLLEKAKTEFVITNDTERYALCNAFLQKVRRELYT